MATELEKISKNTEETRKVSERQQQSLERMGGDITNAIDTQTFAIVASSQALASSFGAGFDNVNNTLDMGFSSVSSQLGGVSSQLSGVSNQLGYMTAAFSVGFDRIADTLLRISKDICDKLDAIHDIANNPRLTEARELYRNAVVSCKKGFFEEAIEDLKAALEKNKTDYISWFLLGEVYLFGKGKFCNVIDFDASISALTSAAKYIDPEIAASAEAKLMASEIWFYLGLAKYNKYNDLKLQEQQAEAKTVLEGALQAYEEAFGLSQYMLEARYNGAKCKALAGNISGALTDLEAVITKDRNYCLKIFADSDFDFMKDDCYKLINQLKHRAFIEVELKYNGIKALVKELEALGGSFSVSQSSLVVYETIDSPLVGTFCTSPSPNSPPFVKPGSKVKAKDSLCILESMNIMYHLEAEFSCEIVSVLASNGHFIQLAQPLFEIKRAHDESIAQKPTEAIVQKPTESLPQELSESLPYFDVLDYYLEFDRTISRIEKLIKKQYSECISGYCNTVGLKANGTVIAVGENKSGQCETGDWRDIVAVSASVSHTVGLKADGTVVAVGDNWRGQCNTGGWRDIVAVSTAFDRTVGLKANGTVVVAGDNRSGQCDTGGWRDIVAVSAGDDHTVGLKADGTVVVAGDNRSGLYETGGWRDIVAVSAANYRTAGLKADGTVVAVGFNVDEKYNTGDWRDIVVVSAAHCRIVGLKADGTVVAVGENESGQCDTGGWRDIVAVSAGDDHTVGLKADGTVVAVGDNKKGQCNTGGWRDIVVILADGKHTVGLKADGTVVAVGDNEKGQCDTGDWRDIGPSGRKRLLEQASIRKQEEQRHLEEQRR